MEDFNILAVCGPYRARYAWASPEKSDTERPAENSDTEKPAENSDTEKPTEKSYTDKPCAWIHDLPGSVIEALDPDVVSFQITVEDLSSALTLRDSALRLLDLLSGPFKIFGANSGGVEDNTGESQAVKPLIIVAQGLSGLAILIGLKKQQYHSVVRRICRLVFFGCPHRVPHPVVWDDLCAKISSLYSDASEPVAGPSYRNQCAIDYASITALSTEFIMIATAYDIVNIYEETGSQSITVGEQYGTLGISSEVSIARNTSYLSLSHRSETFSNIQKEIQKPSTFESRTKPEFVRTYQVLVRLGGLLHAPERDLLARAQGAFIWMTNDSRYSDWLSEEGARILHLRGPTGCGKSNMVGYLASALRTETETRTKQPTVFKFCFNKAYPARASLRGFLVDFILQWLFHLPELYPSIDRLLPVNFEGVPLWKTQTLWETFHQILLHKDRPRIFCLIDDLEDCQPQLKRFIPSILAAIDKHQETKTHPQTPIPGFKLLITSKECTTQLGLPPSHVCINLEAETELKQDKDRIIEEGISQLIQKRPVLTRYKEQFVKKLTKSDITILLANLHFVIPEQCIIDSTPRCIRKELGMIPHSLIDCYGHILESVRGKRRRLVCEAFSWILHANRTLHTKELATALAINPDTYEFDEEDISGDIVSDLGDVVGPLITVIGDQIDFSHWTFRNYIISTEWKEEGTWQVRQFGDDTAALCCLSYLCTILRKIKDSEKDDVTRGISCIDESQGDGLNFLNYAVTNWAYHYLRSMSPVPGQQEMTKTSEECINKLREFLKDREVFNLWFQRYCDLQNQAIAQYEPEKAEQRTILMFLAESGLLSMLPQQAHDLDWLQEEKLGVRDPKQAALALTLSAHLGHCAAVKRLLSCGYVEKDVVMDITKDIANRIDVDEVFPTLLTYVLDKELVDSKFWCSLLCAAIENGHDEAFRLLINSIDSYDLADSWEDLTPFHLAAAFGDEELMKTLISNQDKLKLPSPASQLNPDEPEAGTNGISTPFHVAARNGHLNIIQLLHPEYASIEATTSKAFTPLHLACITGHPGVVSHLIDKGANIDAGLDEFQSPLFYASGNGRREVVKILLDHKPKVKDFQDQWQTPLHWAALGGFLECAQLLLNAGANKDHLQYGTTSPLVCAIESEHLQVVKLLTDHKADLNHTDGLPLYTAIMKKDLEAVKVLLDAGASIEYSRYRYRGIALHHACRAMDVALVELLLSKATQGDLNKEDGSNDTPITEALRLRNNDINTCAEIVKLVLEAGADANAPGGSGERPLERAYNSYEITQVLLAKGAKLDFNQDDWGLYPGGPLWPAVRDGAHSVVSILLTSGARLHDTDDEGRTPLHLACSNRGVKINGNLEIVKALLKHGANPLTKIINPEAGDKLTPLEIAMESRKLDIVEELFKNLFPDDLGEERYIIYSVKEKRDHPEIVSTLVEYSNHVKEKVDVEGIKGEVDVKGKTDVKGKVDVNWKDPFGRTALFYAACSGNEEAVRILLGGGADTSLQDSDWRCARDVVSTTGVRDLIWDHEKESKRKKDEEDAAAMSHGDGKEDTNDWKEDPNDGKEDPDDGKEDPNDVKEDPNDEKEDPNDGKEDPNCGKDDDRKPLQAEQKKPGDKTLNAETCKQTNHKGKCSKTYNWDISWCCICYQELSGFVYHCCDCPNDSYLVCQDCYENQRLKCSNSDHKYRKRFYKNGIASYAEFCDWVGDLVTPSEPKKIIEVEVGPDNSNRVEVGPDNSNKVGVGPDNSNVGPENSIRVEVGSGNSNRVGGTGDQDQLTTPTSPVKPSRRRRRRIDLGDHEVGLVRQETFE